MKKPLAIVSAIVAALTLLFVGVVAPAVAGGTIITKYGDVFTYNGNNSWTIQNTDNDQAIKNIGNTNNVVLCSNYDTGLKLPCTNTGSYTFTGDTSQKNEDCAYVQLDGGGSGSQDTVPGDSSKSVCVPTTSTLDAAAAVTTTPASCASAETVATGTASNATWGTITYSGTGNLQYSVVATAVVGHAFTAGTNVSADGSTETFSGTLDAEQTLGCTTVKVCIPDSAVTYTYSHSDANTGVITVTDVANSTGELCNPFYVTATSWKFTNNSSIWPQKVDVVDQLGKISAPGTYSYAAAVGCGQGDIYASTDATAPSLNPANYPQYTGQLLGANNPFKEHFLSDMGFTQVDNTGKPNNGGATYIVDSDSCFVPAQETGIPQPAAASCQAPDGNSLALPAVPGGQWTISNAGYSKTYGVNSSTTITSVPNGYAAYTVTLSDGSSTDGFSVATKISSWKPVDFSTLDCNTTTTPVAPDVTDVLNCTDGSLVIPTTPGVTYYLNGTKVGAGVVQNLTGSNTVTASADNGFEFTDGSYPVGGWTYDLGSTATCVLPYVLDGCTYNATSGISSQDVTFTFDNTGSKTATSFEVGGTTYTVDAGKTLTQDVGAIASVGGSFDVYVNGATTPVTVTVPSFTTCIPVIAGDPDVSQVTCDAITGSANADGEITVKLDPNLVYTITGPLGPDSTKRTPVTAAVTDLPAGSYLVSVEAVAGYTLTGPATWPLTVDLTPTACTLAPTTVVASCTSNASNPTEIQGQINVVLNSNIIYRINGGSPLTSATNSLPDGSYTLTAELTPAATTAGYRLVGDTSWGPFDFAQLCLPILPAWHADATGSPAICSSTGSTEGSISLLHKASEKGRVKYSIENDATHKVQNVGHTVVKVSEPAGTYTVTAAPVDPRDGISTKTVFTVTIAGATVDCGTLAFTGGGFVGSLGVTLALGMLFLGVVALWMRRRFGTRTAR